LHWGHCPAALYLAVLCTSPFCGSCRCFLRLQIARESGAPLLPLLGLHLPSLSPRLAHRCSYPLFSLVPCILPLSGASKYAAVPSTFQDWHRPHTCLLPICLPRPSPITFTSTIYLSRLPAPCYTPAYGGSAPSYRGSDHCLHPGCRHLWVTIAINIALYTPCLESCTPSPHAGRSACPDYSGATWHPRHKQHVAVHGKYVFAIARLFDPSPSRSASTPIAGHLHTRPLATALSWFPAAALCFLLSFYLTILYFLIFVIVVLL